MPVYISLLRGINVGGNTKISMSELRALYAALGMTEVQTLLQSGNVVFQSDLTGHPALTRQLEDEIEQRFGFHMAVLLRTVDELRDVVSRNPLSMDGTDPSKLVVMFLSDNPTQDAIEGLVNTYLGPETIQFFGKETYLYYPDGQGRSKLTTTFLERKLSVSATARNWNTVTKLLNLAERTEGI